MHVKLRFHGCSRNPPPTLCALKGRNAGKVAFSAVRAQPFADIVRVEGVEWR